MLSDKSFQQRVTIVSSEELKLRDYRLDPSRYNERGEKVSRHLKMLPYRKVLISKWDEVSEIQIPSRFGRDYIESEENGVPFLGSSSILMARLPHDLLLSKNKTRQLSSLVLKEGTIIISRSGTIGVSLICGKSFNGFAASEHCARVYASKKVQGYLKAYIASPLGQELLVQQTHGKVIKEITDIQIGEVQVPVLPNPIFEHVNDLVLSAVDLYDKARESLDKADSLLNTYLGKKEELQNPNLWFDHGKNAFLKAAESLFRERLDPHFYNPDINHLRNILDSKSEKTLGEIAHIWGVGRFKRHHADKSIGTPLYSSADVVRARLEPSIYLSKSRNAKDIQRCKIEKDTILIPCSGTFGGILGRAVIAGKRLHGQAVTQHLLRIKVTDVDYPPGYIAALLMSQRFGYRIITAYRYGKDVPEIEPTDLESIPIPKLKDDEQKEIADYINSASESIDLANELEDIAQRELLNGLQWDN